MDPQKTQGQRQAEDNWLESIEEFRKAGGRVMPPTRWEGTLQTRDCMESLKDSVVEDLGMIDRFTDLLSRGLGE